ncbi:MAG TPA: nicotinate phosphoribosyltransferase [Candidatus Competibacteraceae bacterium]|nr:nicotinate phosphoribosyltransferase [Candidatus Competibacteraceae bacterium]
MSLSHSPLVTDLYQLTMLQAYHQAGMVDSATFELFVRRLPAERGFLLAAGLEQVLEFLENLRFSAEELDWLRSTGRFRDDFLDSLAGLRFRGDVDALPEGTACFGQEPILRVTAPLPQAQLVESRLINIVHYQTLVASKAARSVLAAPGKLLVDFGLRRAHGGEAGLWAARASYIAGFNGSATVLAGMRYGIPVYGTMAHSLVMAFDHEEDAFEHFALSQPDNVVLLIDTYDTLAAAAKLPALAVRLAERGIRIKGVRLDSGDLAVLSREVRRILDEGGLREAIIFASGDLDEYLLAELLRGGAPIDGFGIGTRLTIASDAPHLDCVYKLQEYAGRPRRKRSTGKATWPGRKQIYRCYADGIMSGDCLGLLDHAEPGTPLLQPVMRQGQRLRPAEPLPVIRERARRELAALPEPLRDPTVRGAAYPVTIAATLQALADRLDLETH